MRSKQELQKDWCFGQGGFRWQAGIGTLLLTLLFVLFAFPVFAQAAAEPPPEDPAVAAKRAEITRMVSAGAKSYGQENYEAAVKAFETALKIAEELHDEKRILRITSNLGAAYQRQGNIEKAIFYHQAAITGSEKRGEPEEAIFPLMGLANDYNAIARYEDEILINQKAMGLLIKKKDFPNYASCLSNLSMAYQALGQSEKALELLNEAVTIFKKSEGEGLRLGTTLRQICALYSDMGDYNKALLSGAEALSLKEIAAAPRETAKTMNTLGTIYARLGRFDLARDNLQKAITVLEKTPLADGYTMALLNLGNVCMETGDYEQAIALLKRVLDIRVRGMRSVGIAAPLFNLALAYQRWEKPAESGKYLLRAIEAGKKENDTNTMGFLYNGLGDVYIKQGDYQQARPAFEKAIELRRRFGATSELAQSLHNLGYLDYLTGDLPGAARHFEESQTIWDKALSQIGDASEQGKAQNAFQGQGTVIYARVLLQLHRPEAALIQLEKGRLRGLAQQAAQNQVRLTQFLTQKESQELDERTTEYVRASGMLRGAARLSVSANENGQRAALAQLTNARNRAEEAERRLRLSRNLLLARHPEYGRLQGTKQPTFAEIAAFTKRSPHTMYLVFTLNNIGHSLRFALQNGKLQATSLNIEGPRLQKMIQNWRLALLEQKADEIMARELFTALFRGISLPAKGKDAVDSLVIVANGLLLDVPFAALRDAQGRRLIERFAVSSAFSLGSLTWKPRQVPQKTVPTLLCVADPTLQDAGSLLLAVRGGFAALPAARQEGAAVAQFYRGKMLAGTEPTKPLVLNEIAHYDLLHFATHSVADSRNGLRSFLLLAANKGEDGFLEAREIAGMQLKAELAVLSACETGQGEKQGREGLVGLAWAFRAAGVPAIVASQWKVDDNATKDLMVAFYKSLKAGKKKDAALREAMLTVKKTAPQPYFWAAFQLLGTTEPVR